MSKQTFLDNKLYGMISKVFSGSVPMAIQNAYPNEFQPWELSSCPKGFWKDEENIKQAVRWVVETLLNNNRERVCKEFTGKLLKENGLGTIKKDYGVYGLLNMTYPNEFKPWEVVECGNNFWDEEKNVKEAVRWLVKTKLDNNRQRVCKEFTARFLSKNGFSSLLAYGIYNLLNMAYPNEFKPEELEKAHMIKNYNWRQERRKRVK